MAVLALMGVVLVFALATGFTLFTRLFYFLALTLAGSYIWSWLNLHWLEVRVDRRTVRVHVGHEMVERIRVRSKSWLPKAWLEVVELTDLREHQASRTISLSGYGFRSWRISTRPRRRGVYTMGPVRVATGDPFGLFRLERTYSDIQQVLVLPAVVPLSRFFVPTADMPGDGSLRQRSHQVTPYAATIRDYISSDSVSRIHWPSSARLSRLMVKKFDSGLTSDVWVLLDLHGEVQAQDEEDSTDEMAVVVSASISRFFLNAQLPLGLAVNAKEFELLPPDRGHLQDARIVELLALLKAEGVTPLAEAITNLDPWLNRYTTLVVVTSSSSDQWVQMVGSLAHRNVRVAAVLVDGTTFGGDTSPRTLLPTLAELGVPGYLIGRGDNLRDVLTHPSAAQWAEPTSRAGEQHLLLEGVSP